MQSTPMLRSLSSESSHKREWKQRLSLRDNRRRDPVSVPELACVQGDLVEIELLLYLNFRFETLLEISKFGSYFSVSRKYFFLA